MTTEKIIGIGIVGAGFARTTQIPGFQNCPGARVVAITSRHRENAASVATEFGIEHVASDWKDLVARDDVDLVSVVTPPSTHMEITLAALEHGKAVLCEKPMAMDAAEAKLMTDRAGDAGVLALIDHELRFLNSRQKMRAMLHSGAIGTVRHCNYVFRSDYRGVLIGRGTGGRMQRWVAAHSARSDRMLSILFVGCLLLKSAKSAACSRRTSLSGPTSRAEPCER